MSRVLPPSPCTVEVRFTSTERAVIEKFIEERRPALRERWGTESAADVVALLALHGLDEADGLFPPNKDARAGAALPQRAGRERTCRMEIQDCLDDKGNVFGFVCSECGEDVCGRIDIPYCPYCRSWVKEVV